MESSFFLPAIFQSIDRGHRMKTKMPAHRSPFYFFGGVLFLLFSAAVLQAQPPRVKNHHLGLSLGLADNVNKDLLASPLRYRGTSLPLQLGWDYLGSHNRHDARFILSVSNLHSKITERLGPESHFSEYVAVGLRYSYLRHAGSVWRGKWRVYVGAAWNNLFSIRNYHYERRLDEETIAEVFSSLALSGAGERAFGAKQALRLHLSAAILTLAFRNPYGLQQDRIGAIGTYHSYFNAFGKLAELKTPDEFLHFQSTMTYSRALSAYFNLNLDYLFSLSYFTKPQKSTTVQNSLFAGMRFKF